LENSVENGKGKIEKRLESERGYSKFEIRKGKSENRIGTVRSSGDGSENRKKESAWTL
jgi:hypothetical protein